MYSTIITFFHILWVLFFMKVYKVVFLFNFFNLRAFIVMFMYSYCMFMYFYCYVWSAVCIFLLCCILFHRVVLCIVCV